MTVPTSPRRILPAVPASPSARQPRRRAAIGQGVRLLLAMTAGVSLAATALPGDANAQTLPDLVRIVVPFSAGGSNDQIARAIAPLLAKRLGVSVIVENRPGAGSVIGSDFVAKAPPDASVLLLNSSSFLTAAATQPKTPFDPVRSFAPVAMIGEGPMLLATSASAPYRSAADLIKAAGAKPNAISYGSSGIGSIAQLTTEILATDAGVSMLHVPYKGAANALLDLVGGQIDLMVSNYSSIAAQIKADKVRPLAVTSATASPAFPGLPPVAATLPGFGVDIWVGVFAPAGTQPALVDRLNRELTGIAASPEVRNLLDPDGAIPSTLSPAAFAERVRGDFERWKRIATDKGIVAQ